MYDATSEVTKELVNAKRLSENGISANVGNSEFREIEEWHIATLDKVIIDLSYDSLVEYLDVTSIKYIDKVCRIKGDLNLTEFDAYLNWRANMVRDYLPKK